jgi:hypothetical protein
MPPSDKESVHSSFNTETTSPIPAKPTIEVDPVIEKKLLRKLDFRLMTFAFFSYFTSNLVRNNMRM